MRKKGFTLVELLAVIAIIGLISLIAIPNIVGLSTGVRKDNMLDDAKKLISLAKYMVNSDATIRNFTNTTYCGSSQCVFSFDVLNANGDIGKDPDNGDYVTSESYVRYSIESSKATYCIVLKGSVREIGHGGCVNETMLYSRSNVTDR